MSRTHWQYEAGLGSAWEARWPAISTGLGSAARIAASVVVRGWLKTYHRLTISGAENLPRHGSFVMVANHASHLDVLCALAVLPLGTLNHAYPAAAEDYFFVNVPARRGGDVRQCAAIRAAASCAAEHQLLYRRLLADGENVLILFPEGTRSVDGRLGEFRPGVGRLVAGLDVPVVPVAIDGTHRALPKGAMVPRPCRLSVRIGATRNYLHASAGKDSARQISRELHDAVGRVFQCA